MGLGLPKITQPGRDLGCHMFPPESTEGLVDRASALCWVPGHREQTWALSLTPALEAELACCGPGALIHRLLGTEAARAQG